MLKGEGGEEDWFLFCYQDIILPRFLKGMRRIKLKMGSDHIWALISRGEAGTPICEKGVNGILSRNGFYTESVIPNQKSIGCDRSFSFPKTHTLSLLDDRIWTLFCLDATWDLERLRWHKRLISRIKEDAQATVGLRRSHKTRRDLVRNGRRSRQGKESRHKVIYATSNKSWLCLLELSGPFLPPF